MNNPKPSQKIIKFASLNIESWLRLIIQDQNYAIDPYDNDWFFLQILKIRAQTEGIQVDDESLTMLGETGSKNNIKVGNNDLLKMRSRWCTVFLI